MAIDGRLIVDDATFTAQTVTINGEVVLTEAAITATSGQSVVGLSGIVSGSGTIVADLDVNGTIAAGQENVLRLTGNVTRIAGALTGDGTIELAEGVFDIKAGASITVDTLKMTDAIVFINTGTRTLRTDLILERSSTNGGSFDMLGDIRLDDSAVDPMSIRLRAGSSLSATGESQVSGDIVNRGVVTVEDGLFTIFGSVVSGAATGRFVIEEGATLQVTDFVPRNQSIVMNGNGAALTLGDGEDFRGVIRDFTSGDTITFAAFSSEGATARWAGDRDGSGGYVVLLGENGRETVRFEDGAFERDGFYVVDNGAGGSTIGYIPPGSSAPLHDPTFAALPELLMMTHDFAFAFA